MSIIAKYLGKISAGGVLISAFGCAGCFPALGALGATLGLGFLSSYEGVFINKLMPLFAGLAILFNLYGWFTHKKHLRGLISLVGPGFVLLTLYPLWSYNWSTYLLYAGLVIMLSFSIYDLVRPANTERTVRD